MTLDFSMRDLLDKVARVHAESVWQTIVFRFDSYFFIAISNFKIIF
jgi:hypothetical protein